MKISFEKIASSLIFVMLFSLGIAEIEQFYEDVDDQKLSLFDIKDMEESEVEDEIEDLKLDFFLFITADLLPDDLGLTSEFEEIHFEEQFVRYCGVQLYLLYRNLRLPHCA